MTHKLLVSVREAAEMLGVSVRTMHRYCALGILSPVRVGRRKLLKTAALLQFAEVGISLAALNRVREAIGQRNGANAK